MQIIRELNNYVPIGKPLLLALGNFDGVHCGHQKVITALVERAHTIQGTAAAFIFDPHPATILTPNRVPRMLVTAGRKAELLQKLGLDLLIYQSFSLEMARWSPEEFVKRILVDRIQICEVFVGFNYSFGYRGAGTPGLLETLGRKYGFQAHIMPPVIIADEVVSSSLVRVCLEHRDISQAYHMLGYYPI
jgi:riboflavin kinase/FMN adenylyltransferase